MKKLFLLFGLVWATNTVFAADKIGISTGIKDGTYYQMGLDLKELGRKNKFDVTVRTSEGAGENLINVLKHDDLHLGFVQSDSLLYLAMKSKKNDDLKRQYDTIREKSRVVTILNTEEIHVIGRKDITAFRELQHKKIAIGTGKSGSSTTAILLSTLLDVKYKDVMTQSADRALEALKMGEVDAMIFVAGAPVDLLKSIKPSDGLHLIPFSAPSRGKVAQLYQPATIEAGTYEWQKKAVETLSVRTVLMAYDFKGETCDKIGRFAQLLKKNIRSLKRRGHEKWQEVKFSQETVPDWPASSCINSGDKKLSVVAKAAKRSDSTFVDASEAPRLIEAYLKSEDMKYKVDSDGDFKVTLTKGDDDLKFYIMFNRYKKHIWKVKLVARFSLSDTTEDELLKYSNKWNATKNFPKLSVTKKHKVTAEIDVPIEYGFNLKEFTHNSLSLYKSSIWKVQTQLFDLN